MIAAISIHDPAEFARRLAAATPPRLPGWGFGHGNARYYDPHEPAPDEEISALVSKDISFAFQKEHRFFWAPPQGTPPIKDHAFLNLGPLQDITELYVPKRA